MIVDAIATPILAVLEALIDLLPVGGSMNIPGVSAVLEYLAKVNSVIPIAGPLAVVVSILALLVVWLAIRIAIMLWQQLPLT